MAKKREKPFTFKGLDVQGKFQKREKNEEKRGFMRNLKGDLRNNVGFPASQSYLLQKINRGNSLKAIKLLISGQIRFKTHVSLCSSLK